MKQNSNPNVKDNIGQGETSATSEATSPKLDTFSKIASGFTKTQQTQATTLSPDSEVEDTPTGSDDSETTNVKNEVDEAVTDETEEDEVTEEETEGETEDEEETNESGSETDETPESEESEDATSEDDSEDSTDEEEDAEPFFVGEDSMYKTPDEAKRGIEAKDRLIKEWREDRKHSSERIAELEQVNQFISNVVTEDQIIATMVENALPDDLKNLNEAEAEGEVLRKLLYEKGKLESQIRSNLEQAKAKSLQDNEARSKRAIEARNHVESLATMDFFGIKNTEQREAFQKKKREKDANGFSLMDKAALIADTFGNDEAETYLIGVREKTRGTSNKPEEKKVEDTKPKPESKKKTVSKKVVEKVKKTKVELTPSIPAPSKNVVVPKTKEEKISQGFTST